MSYLIPGETIQTKILDIVVSLCRVIEVGCPQTLLDMSFMLTLKMSPHFLIYSVLCLRHSVLNIAIYVSSTKIEFFNSKLITASDKILYRSL